MISVGFKRVSNQKRPSAGIDKGLSDFLRDVHQPLVDNPALQLSDIPAHEKYINVINRIHHATALTDNEFSSFLRSLRFFLGQAGKEEQKKLIDVRLGALGIGRQSLRSSSSPLWNGRYLATKYEHVMF